MEGIIVFVFLAFIVLRVVKQSQNSANAYINEKKKTQNSANTYINNAKPAQNFGNAKRKATGVNKNLHGGTSGSAEVVNIKNRTSLAALSATMENRGSDWLARQLAEERAAKRRMSEMFDLKREHADNCDAARVREYSQVNSDAARVREYSRVNSDAARIRENHQANCDANAVDTARG